MNSIGNNPVLGRCCDGHQTHNQLLLTPLRESIIDRPPYICGTLQVPDDSFFSLFYKVARDGNAARHINFANATPDELEQLTQACQVPNEFHCKAGNMDSERFSSSMDPYRTDLIRISCGYLLEGEQSTKGIKIEPHKLSIYGKCSSFKPHIDIPRSKKLFGSLMIVFPTCHEGGALFLRRRGREWILDPGRALAGGYLDPPSIGYVAFLNDTEQEVAPVTSGHRVTLIYNLYFDDGGSPVIPVSKKDAVSRHFTSPKPTNQDEFREAFEALLENPEFMADGGTIAFGLRHSYPIQNGFEPVYDVLKGSDTVVYHGVRALGFEPTLYMYYCKHFDSHEGMIVPKVTDFDNVPEDWDLSVRETIQAIGGILVRQDGGEICYYDDSFSETQCPAHEPMEWATPLTTYNRMKTLVGPGDACMIVRIGRAGDRLTYPTLAHVIGAYERGRYTYDLID